MNTWVGLGNITKDISTSESGKVGYATLAVSSTEKGEDGKYLSRFIPLRFLGEKTVDTVKKYLSKGIKIAVTGELVIDRREDNGEWKTNAYVIVRTWEFAQKKDEGQKKEPEPTPDGWATIPEGIDEELPFT